MDAADDTGREGPKVARRYVTTACGQCRESKVKVNQCRPHIHSDCAVGLMLPSVTLCGRTARNVGRETKPVRILKRATSESECYT